LKRPDRNPTPKEVLLEAVNLSSPEARLVVANYYAAQAQRKRLDMQIRHYGDKDIVADPAPTFLGWSADFWATHEKQTLALLERYARADKAGEWMLAQHGVGPVIAAGCLANLDIEKAPTAGHFLAFSGLDPTKTWEKGQKRPYNPDMKQIVYHFGECMKRASANPDCVYGKLYRSRKEWLEQRNERGDFAERAKTFVLKSTDGPAAKALKAGKLPAFNLDRQACNYAAKIFLCHLHGVMHWVHFNRVPPRPFPLAHLGHGHEITIPNTADILPGFARAYYGMERAA
jgi:hypothetical protein